MCNEHVYICVLVLRVGMCSRCGGRVPTNVVSEGVEAGIQGFSVRLHWTLLGMQSGE